MDLAMANQEKVTESLLPLCNYGHLFPNFVTQALSTTVKNKLKVNQYLWVRLGIKMSLITWPWLVWLSALSPSIEAKGRWFDSQSGHMPGLQASSLVGCM